MFETRWTNGHFWNSSQAHPPHLSFEASWITSHGRHFRRSTEDETATKSSFESVEKEDLVPEWWPQDRIYRPLAIIQEYIITEYQMVPEKNIATKDRAVQLSSIEE